MGDDFPDTAVFVKYRHADNVALLRFSVIYYIREPVGLLLGFQNCHDGSACEYAAVCQDLLDRTAKNLILGDSRVGGVGRIHVDDPSVAIGDEKTLIQVVDNFSIIYIVVGNRFFHIILFQKYIQLFTFMIIT